MLPLIGRIRDMLRFTAATVTAPAVVLGVAASAPLLTTPAVAQASPAAVIRDCAQDGKLDRHYSLSDLKKAEHSLPTDIDEYTNCRDVINQAEVQSSRGGNGTGHGALSGPGGGAAGGGGRGGAAGVSQADVRALNRATSASDAPSVSLHGQKVVPGTGGLLKTAGAANSLPLPVLLALIAVGGLTASGGFLALRRRFPGVVGAALRVFRR
jgi:hypothetical protein